MDHWDSLIKTQPFLITHRCYPYLPNVRVRTDEQRKVKMHLGWTPDLPINMYVCDMSVSQVKSKDINKKGGAITPIFHLQTKTNETVHIKRYPFPIVPLFTIRMA